MVNDVVNSWLVFGSVDFIGVEILRFDKIAFFRIEAFCFLYLCWSKIIEVGFQPINDVAELYGFTV